MTDLPGASVPDARLSRSHDALVQADHETGSPPVAVSVILVRSPVDSAVTKRRPVPVPGVPDGVSVPSLTTSTETSGSWLPGAKGSKGLFLALPAFSYVSFGSPPAFRAARRDRR